MKKDYFTKENLDNIDAYKWLKVAQSIVLMVLGIIFVVISYFALRDSTGDNSKTATLQLAFSYCIATVFVVYGVLNIIAGYMLFRSPISREVTIGLLALAFAIVLYVYADQNILGTTLNIFLISLLFGYAIVFICYGIDLILKRNKTKEGKLTKPILSFIAAAVLIALAIVYIIYGIVIKDTRDIIKNAMMIIVGVVIFAIGIILLVSILKKIKNTKETIEEMAIEKKKEEAQENNDTGIVKNDDVKVIDISDLKKNDRKNRKNNKHLLENKEDNDEKKEDKPSDKDKKDDENKDGELDTKSNENKEGKNDDNK